MKPLLAHLPSSNEAEFGVGWANLIDFVAAMLFDINYNSTIFLQEMVVPPRMLTLADHAPFIADFSAEENRALLLTQVLLKANNFTRGLILREFRRVCCTPEGRKDAYSACIGIIEHPLKDWTAIVDMLRDLVRAHPLPCLRGIVQRR